MCKRERRREEKRGKEYGSGTTYFEGLEGDEKFRV